MRTTFQHYCGSPSAVVGEDLRPAPAAAAAARRSRRHRHNFPPIYCCCMFGLSCRLRKSIDYNDFRLFKAPPWPSRSLSRPPSLCQAAAAPWFICGIPTSLGNQETRNSATSAVVPALLLRSCSCTPSALFYHLCLLGPPQRNPLRGNPRNIHSNPLRCCHS